MTAIKAEFCTFNRVIPVQGAIMADVQADARVDWLAPGAWLGELYAQAAPNSGNRPETGLRAREKARIRGLNALDYLTGGHPNALA